MIGTKTELKNRRTNLRHYHFSKMNLAVVALVVAGIGGYILLTSSAASAVGDANSDGQVNAADLTLLKSNFATTNTSTDFNNDGKTSIFDLSILLSHYGSTVSTPPSSSFASVYGVPYAASSLANLRVGDDANYGTEYRFRPDHTGSLEGFRMFWIDKTGYAGGNGGIIQMSIQTDDGTANHYPSGTTIGQPIVYHPNLVNAIDQGGNASRFQFFTFPSPISVVQGQLYHLVYTNLDSNYANNFHSVDMLVAGTQGAGGLQRIDHILSGLNSTDWGVSERYTGSGGWRNASPESDDGDDYTPILDLKWTDGHHMGNGYMEVWLAKPVTLTATGNVRERFTPSTSKTINKITVEAITTAAGSLTARLETGTGTLIQQGTTSITGDGRGHWFSFTIPVTTLQAGQTYNLVLSTPTGSAKVYTLRDGNKGFNFDPATTFSDGLAQQLKSGTWVNWEDNWSTDNVDRADLSFYFSIVN